VGAVVISTLQPASSRCVCGLDIATKTTTKHTIYRYKQGIMRATSTEIKKPSLYWEIIILILSIYVFIELAIEVIYPFDQQTQTILDYIDFGICVIFLYDFFHFLFTSEDKRKYLKKRWIDFISSIPFIGVFRILRIARIFRAIRILRVFKILKGLKSFAPIINWISENKLGNILVTYVFILVLIMIYCSIAFYNFEKNINENIGIFHIPVYKFEKNKSTNQVIGHF